LASWRLYRYGWHPPEDRKSLDRCAADRLWRYVFVQMLDDYASVLRLLVRTAEDAPDDEPSFLPCATLNDRPPTRGNPTYAGAARLALHTVTAARPRSTRYPPICTIQEDAKDPDHPLEIGCSARLVARSRPTSASLSRRLLYSGRVHRVNATGAPGEQVTLSIRRDTAHARQASHDAQARRFALHSTLKCA
jgi:hypothetical protein